MGDIAFAVAEIILALCVLYAAGCLFAARHFLPLLDRAWFRDGGDE